MKVTGNTENEALVPLGWAELGLFQNGSSARAMVLDTQYPQGHPSQGRPKFFEP